jgi:hypothetical protein
MGVYVHRSRFRADITGILTQISAIKADCVNTCTQGEVLLDPNQSHWTGGDRDEWAAKWPGVEDTLRVGSGDPHNVPRHLDIIAMNLKITANNICIRAGDPPLFTDVDIPT